MNRTQNGPAYTSLEQIYHQYKDMVYSIALAAVQNPRDAEDITLYTFREARNILNADPSAKHIASQLLDIVSVESLRTVSNRDNGIPYINTQNNIIGNEADDFMLPLEYAQRSDLQARLMQVINALPIYQRMALVMYVYNHLTVRAAAAAMRCSEQTALSHLCTAKATVKQQLEEIAYRSGEYFNSTEMIPFNQVYTGLIAGQAMSSQSASYIWDALQQTVDRGEAYAAPPVQPKGMSTGSKIALWLSAAASVLVLVTVCAVIGFSPKASTKTPSATEIETVVVVETTAPSSSSKTTSSAPRDPKEPRQPQPERRPEREPKSSSSSSKSNSSSSSKKSSSSSSKKSSSSSSSSSSTPSSKAEDNEELTDSEILAKMAGTYNEQKSAATDDFNTMQIKSDGSISLFNLSFMTKDNTTGYRYATISNLTTKKKGIYSFTASNGDAPLSGTKFTYYSAGTAISDLPFTSSYFETDGSVLKKAVIVDSSKAVYK